MSDYTIQVGADSEYAITYLTKPINVIYGMPGPAGPAGGGGGGGSSTWGAITGTLSDQTDLDDALDALTSAVGALSSSKADQTDLDTLRTDLDATYDELTNDFDFLANQVIPTLAPLASPAFTGTVTGITKSMVGLGNVDNTSDANKPVSTLQAAGDTAAKARANHTGTQLASTISDFSTAADARITAASLVPTTRTVNSKALSSNIVLTQDDVASGTTNKAYTATEQTKLAGIASGATANSSDSTLENRANHTGTQLASTISDFNTAAVAAVTVTNGKTVQVVETLLPGPVVTSTGTIKFPVTRTGTCQIAAATLSTAGGSSTVVAIKKNGSAFTTVTLTSSTAVQVNTALALSVTSGDYLTFDVTSAGSSADTLFVQVEIES